MFANQVILVTGASRGIGKAIATRLGDLGGSIVGTATTESGATAISDHFRVSGIQGRGMVLDVTDQNAVTDLLEKVTREYAAPGILVNNAGITRDNLLMRMKEDEWDAIIATNLTSLYRLCKGCLRGMMKARKGRIINIASVVGATGNIGQSNYAAAKAGMIGFTKSLAREVGSRGITVNAVAPGFIDTDMTRELSEEQRQTLLSSIPLGRLGQVEEIASVVAFLASPEAGYITGETIHVNGGMYMA
ncbi:MAG: 3-oxoacyl-ACP reductase FabG [Gammaproteobacteria bacterium]|nr:3-oxoacyl-ACP reductase FabG [Gammaproteobacteria bacterium]MCP5418295.1 3-oxoacyl-ACP reductase FabG [Chromatiaceae bacterium]